jgi:hypothetical protein
VLFGHTFGIAAPGWCLHHDEATPRDALISAMRCTTIPDRSAGTETAASIAAAVISLVSYPRRAARPPCRRCDPRSPNFPRPGPVDVPALTSPKNGITSTSAGRGDWVRAAFVLANDAGSGGIRTLGASRHVRFQAPRGDVREQSRGALLLVTVGNRRNPDRGEQT